jgi:hypothetical protein
MESALIGFKKIFQNINQTKRNECGQTSATMEEF